VAVEIASVSAIPKKSPRLPWVNVKPITTSAEPTSPDRTFTLSGVPNEVNFPIHAGAAPSSAATAWTRSAPMSHTTPLPNSVRMMRMPKIGPSTSLPLPSTPATLS
jgi:hypothetical protein